MALWVGGLFAVFFVLVPVLKSGIASPKESARLVAMAVQRFQRISREVILLILLTGIFNLILAGVARGFQFSAAYLTMLAAKVGLFAAIVAIQAWQSFRLAPALVSITSGTEQASGPAPAAIKRLQRQALVTSLLSLIFAVAAILLGLRLRYG